LEAKRLELVAERKEGLWNENRRFFHRTALSLILIFLSNTHDALRRFFYSDFSFGKPELAVFQLIRKCVIDVISL
jgi:hypothetical protein